MHDDTRISRTVPVSPTIPAGDRPRTSTPSRCPPRATFSPRFPHCSDSGPPLDRGGAPVRGAQPVGRSRHETRPGRDLPGQAVRDRRRIRRAPDCTPTELLDVFVTAENGAGSAGREWFSVYGYLILSATGVGVGDGRVSRLPASPCGGVGLTVSHTDACGAGTCCFGFTPNSRVTVGRLRRTRRCRGLLGVGPFLSRDGRTGACSATRIAGSRPRRRVTLFLPSSARLARFTPARWSRLPPTWQRGHHAVW